MVSAVALLLARVVEMRTVDKLSRILWLLTSRTLYEKLLLQ
jgi:hypothetical protein